NGASGGAGTGEGCGTRFDGGATAGSGSAVVTASLGRAGGSGRAGGRGGAGRGVAGGGPAPGGFRPRGEGGRGGGAGGGGRRRREKSLFQCDIGGYLGTRGTRRHRGAEKWGRTNSCIRETRVAGPERRGHDADPFPIPGPGRGVDGVGLRVAAFGARRAPLVWSDERMTINRVGARVKQKGGALGKIIAPCRRHDP